MERVGKIIKRRSLIFLPQWRMVFLVMPALIFLIVFFLYAICRMFLYSLFDPQFTLKNYIHIFTTPVYIKVILTTFKISLSVTLICFVIGYWVAYLLSNIKEKKSEFILMVIMGAFLISFLVKMYVWIVVLQRKGIVNQTLMHLKITSHPVNLIYNFIGVNIGMVQILLPYMILPLYSVMKGIDRNLLKAAQSLGANPIKTFIKVFFPLSLPGISAGILQVFILALGYFIIPALLGGKEETMISQLIAFQVNQFGNWGFASALSVFLLAIILAIFMIYNRYLGLERMWGGIS